MMANTSFTKPRPFIYRAPFTRNNNRHIWLFLRRIQITVSQSAVRNMGTLVNAFAQRKCIISLKMRAPHMDADSKSIFPTAYTVKHATYETPIRSSNGSLLKRVVAHNMVTFSQNIQTTIHSTPSVSIEL